MHTFYRWQDNDLVLFVRLQPLASRNESLTALPVEGKANSALGKFLAKTFGIANQLVTLESN